MDEIDVTEVNEFTEFIEPIQTEVSLDNEQYETIVSYLSTTADNTAVLSAQLRIETVLTFIVIAFVGFACGLLISNCIRR